ncbi:MAG: hypothetical protein JO037_02655 [Actinobacteria bacterium]|nr:hypothetical protein [Actinomycetota bacterium]
MDRWSGQLAAGAGGWLGSTAGVTGDGRFVALARFESAEAARRNSDRPEQGQWWAETSKLFTGEVTFADSSDVTVDVHGDPGQAGFVQVMQGRVSDLGRARELMAQNPDDWTAFRPDVIGSVTVGHQGGGYTLAFYFTSEQAAREGERKEPPAWLRAQMEEMNQLNIGEPEFLDLQRPWLYSP